MRIAFLVLAGAFSAATAQAQFELTGTYEGLYACDSTTEGVPSSWSRPMAAKILQDGTEIRIDLAYTDKLEQAEGADAALIYFAGHGIESDGRNWLLPIDTKLIVSSSISDYLHQVV